MGSFQNLTGQTFRNLTVLRRHPLNQGTQPLWECRCACGNTAVVKGSALREGYQRDCGCQKTRTAATRQCALPGCQNPTAVSSRRAQHCERYCSDACRRERDRLRHLRRRTAARKTLARLKDVPCADCGVRYPPYVLDFDHRDPDDKSFNISKNVAGRLLEEVAKCDVVCANCHRERTHVKGHSALRKELTLGQMGIALEDAA